MTDPVETVSTAMIPPDDYDWPKAFDTAMPPGKALGESYVGVDPFTPADVRRVIARIDGENDGPSWEGVFELNDGRFAFVTAGCDYTGWDCQARGSSLVALDLAALIQFGVGDASRRRLGLQDWPPVALRR